MIIDLPGSFFHLSKFAVVSEGVLISRGSDLLNVRGDADGVPVLVYFFSIIMIHLDFKMQ